MSAAVRLETLKGPKKLDGTLYAGHACSARLEVGFDVIIIAMNPSQAAAVCEYLTGFEMDLKLIKPALVGSPTWATEWEERKHKLGEGKP